MSFMDEIRRSDAVILGVSAGAMNMGAGFDKISEPTKGEC